MTTTSLVCTDRLSGRIGVITVELDKAFSWVLNATLLNTRGQFRKLRF
jgi:hypothetical protein